jgi:serine/threonine protein kinase
MENLPSNIVFNPATRHLKIVDFGIDSNYPSVILAVIILLENAANRVRRENLTVRPAKEMQIFELVGDRLYVPDFAYLNGELLYASATEGSKIPRLRFTSIQFCNLLWEMLVKKQIFWRNRSKT